VSKPYRHLSNVADGIAAPRRACLGLSVARPLVMTKPDRRGRLLAAAATLFGNPARKTPSIAVAVENNFS